MKQKNKFYVLKSNTDSTLSTYSYNTSTGEYQIVTDTYGFPNPVYLTGSKANKHYKPVFIPASDIQYSNIEVICYVCQCQGICPALQILMHTDTSQQIWFTIQQEACVRIIIR